MKESCIVLSARDDIRQTRGFILSRITVSHALFHAFRQSLLVLLPNVRDAFALSNVQTTSITAVQEVVAGCIDLPGGVVMFLYGNRQVDVCIVAGIHEGNVGSARNG